jgi:S1-C subfamily serine protease
MVVLAGSGHLLYNLGINRRAFEKSQLPFKTVVFVVIPKDKQGIEVSRTLADYVWGIPEEEKPAYPSLGLSFKKISGLENLVIDKKPIDGVAEDGNFEKGDVILSVDGKTFKDINELRVYLARFTWGNEVKFLLLRDAEEIQVGLKFLAVKKEKEKQY